MSTTTLYLLALAVGIIAGVYLPLNSRFSEQLGSPLLATSIFFIIGAATAVVAWTIAGQGGLDRVSQADGYLFALGSVSFGIILCATLLIPKMGPAAYFVCLVSGQVIAGMALSHFGFLSPQPLPVTPIKFIGAAAVIVGVLLICYAEGQQLQAGEARSKNATLAADRDRPSGGRSLAGSDRGTLSGR
jgi:transporter family-2 protein